VPSVFFLEAERFREAPFWIHKSLTPLEEHRGDSTVVAACSREMTKRRRRWMKKLTNIIMGARSRRL